MSTGGQPSVGPPRPPSSAARLAAIAGGVCCAIAMFFVVVWFVDAPLASPRMKTNTALGLALAGGAILARGLARSRVGDAAERGDPLGVWLERIAAVLATLALAIAVATGLEFLTPVQLGIDELLVHDPDVGLESGAYPNRMAPNAALAIGGLALAVLAGRVRRLGALSQVIACVVLAVATLAILGYAYGVPALYRPTSFVRISPFTAGASVLGSIGALALRTDVGLSRLAASKDAVGLITRRMLLVTFVVPVVLGWLRLEGDRRGLFTSNVGTSLFVLAVVVTFSSVVVSLARSIEANETRRRAAEERLRLAAALTGELARAATVEEVATATLGAGIRALGAKSGGLMLMEQGDSALRSIGTRGFDGAIASRYAVIPLESDVPVATAARTRAPVFVRSRREMTDRYDVPDEHIGEHRSWAALPLIGRSRRLGVLALSFAEAQRFDEAAQSELQRLGSQCAQALERALALQSLESATRRLHATLEAGSIGTYSWELGTDRVEHDAGIARIFGLTSIDGHDASNFTERIHPDDRERWTTALEAVSGAGEDVELRYRVVRPDGTIRWVLDKGQTLRDEDGTMLMIGAVVDLTEEHRAREDAERANRAKDEFLAMLGHELRNPLAPIRTALELMELRGGDTLRKERSVIERQVEHMVRLVDDLLDVSRITRGSVELRARTVDLAAVFAKAREIAVPLFERKMQRVEIEVPAGLPIVADEHRLCQAIANLLTNAAKYTPARGRIVVRARAEDGDVVLEVRDEGVGIAPALLPRLFEPFVQGERTIDRSEGGLGLGLTIVKTLVEMHGGTITAHSEGAGCGATFTLRLQRATDLAPAPSPAREVAMPSTPPSSRRVLVVDDNRDAAELLGEALAAAGHHVEIAFDGPSALEVAKRQGPEVAFLDIGLPVMDGYELARRLRQQDATRAATLVAVTGYGLESDRAQATAAGFDHHLVKPIELDDALALASETRRVDEVSSSAPVDVPVMPPVSSGGGGARRA